MQSNMHRTYETNNTTKATGHHFHIEGRRQYLERRGTRHSQEENERIDVEKVAIMQAMYTFKKHQ